MYKKIWCHKNDILQSAVCYQVSTSTKMKAYSRHASLLPFLIFSMKNFTAPIVRSAIELATTSPWTAQLDVYCLVSWKCHVMQNHNWHHQLCKKFAKETIFNIWRNEKYFLFCLSISCLVTIWAKSNQNHCRQDFSTRFCQNCNQTADK